MHETIDPVRKPFSTSIRVLVAALVTSPFLLSGCQSRYTDVSREPEYAARVGQRCTVLKGLRGHGYTLDLRRKDLTHEVDVTPVPGIDGPEITFKVDIPQGTTIVVSGVRKCSNCLFEKIDYAVSIPSLPELASHRVFARANALAPAEAKCTSQIR